MHKHQCIFIHIPKNAGSSVLGFFGDAGGRKHAFWYDFFESKPYLYEKYYKFCIVRHPLDRLYSAYCYSIKGGNGSDLDKQIMERIVRNSHSFETFIEHVLTPDFLMLQTLFTPQYLYVYDRNYQLKVDKILRYENLQSDWLEITQKLGLTGTLKKVNQSRSVNEIPPLNEKSRLKIQKLYAFDFKLFQYST